MNDDEQTIEMENGLKMTETQNVACREQRGIKNEK